MSILSILHQKTEQKLSCRIMQLTFQEAVKVVFFLRDTGSTAMLELNANANIQEVSLSKHSQKVI